MCNLGSIQGQAACCLFGAGFLHKEGRQVTVCSLNLQISPASKNRAPIGDSLSFIFSHRHGYCDVFLVGKCFESFWFWAIWAIDWRALRKLDNYVLRGKREHFTPCLRASLFVWKRKFFLRFQKNSRPLVEFSHSLRLFTCIPWIDLKTITYPTAHAWRLRVRHHEPAKLSGAIFKFLWCGFILLWCSWKSQKQFKMSKPGH